MHVLATPSHPPLDTLPILMNSFNDIWAGERSGVRYLRYWSAEQGLHKLAERHSRVSEISECHSIFKWSLFPSKQYSTSRTCRKQPWQFLAPKWLASHSGKLPNTCFSFTDVTLSLNVHRDSVSACMTNIIVLKRTLYLKVFSRTVEKQRDLFVVRSTLPVWYPHDSCGPWSLLF